MNRAVNKLKADAFKDFALPIPLLSVSKSLNFPFNFFQVIFSMIGYTTLPGNPEGVPIPLVQSVT